MSQTIDINRIESSYLKARIQKIQARADLNDDKKLQASYSAIHKYILRTTILRAFLSILTLFSIWPLYNVWASQHGRESRWFRLKEEELYKEIKLIISEPTSLIEEGDEQASANKDVVQPAETKKGEEQSKEASTKVTKDEPDKVLNDAAKHFTAADADQRLFKTWYSTDSTRLLLNMPKNWSQVIRVQFNDGDGDDNVDTFILQLSQLIVLSKEFNRVALFIAKLPGASIHFIAGLYFENKLVFVDPMGLSTEKLSENQYLNAVIIKMKEQNEALTVHLSSTIIQHDPKDDDFELPVSCGPIVTEFAMYIGTSLTRARLEDFFAHLHSDFVDIQSLLPSSLVVLIDEKDEQTYIHNVEAIRTKHSKYLSNIPSKIKVEEYLNKLDNSSTQVLFNFLVLNQSDLDDENIRDSYNELALEVGGVAKRDHLQFVNSFSECDYGQLKILGSGSSASTVKYEAKDQTLAIKTFNKNTDKNFQRESELLFRITHENVIRYIGCGNYQSVFNYIALEYAELGDLKCFIKSSFNYAPHWDVKFKFARDIASGMVYLHGTAKVIHRDLKPANVLVTWTKGEFTAKISDFDLSTSAVNPEYRYVGTPLYMPPEVYAKHYPKFPKHKDIEPAEHSDKSDVYTYGIILWELDTWTVIKGGAFTSQRTYGKKILSGTRLETLEALQHPGVAKLVAQCWNLRHKERPSAVEVLEAVKGFNV